MEEYKEFECKKNDVFVNECKLIKKWDCDERIINGRLKWWCQFWFQEDN